MASRRSYRPELTDAEILEQLKVCAGTQCDPEIVDILLTALGDIKLTDEIYAVLDAQPAQL